MKSPHIAGVSDFPAKSFTNFGRARCSPLDRPKARCEHMISDRAYAQRQSGKVIQDRGSGGHHERIMPRRTSASA
jgi:hypothetical protein